MWPAQVVGKKQYLSLVCSYKRRYTNCSIVHSTQNLLITLCKFADSFLWRRFKSLVGAGFMYYRTCSQVLAFCAWVRAEWQHVSVQRWRCGAGAWSTSTGPWSENQPKVLNSVPQPTQTMDIGICHIFLNGQTRSPAAWWGTRSRHAASAPTETWFGHYQLADFHFNVWAYVCIIKSCLLLRGLSQKDFSDPSCGWGFFMCVSASVSISGWAGCLHVF